MKINKLKKILISSLVATTSMGAAVGISVGLLSTKKQQAIEAPATPNTNTGGLDSNQTLPNTNAGGTNSNQIAPNTNSMNLGEGLGYQTSNFDDTSAYRFALKSKTVETIDKGEASTITEYVMTIDNNIQKEGVIYLIDGEGNMANQLTFKPGETIKIGIILNEGYEKYTARDLKVFGKSKNIFVPSSKVVDKENMFQVVMPEYEKTLDPKTGESWFYDEKTQISVLPTFIQASIGNGTENKVEWEHGAFHDSLNGYVYELKNDTTWSTVSKKIYNTFANENINYPIDIYFYMNGNNITFDVSEINLDIPSGWALHFYNNKYDKKDETKKKYGEIIVPEGKKSYLAVGGSLTMGSSVKFRMYHDTNGINFINYDEKLIVDDIKNDPEVRLGGR